MRIFRHLAAALILGAIALTQAQAAETPKVFRVGFQKLVALVLLRQQQGLEKRLGPQGIKVEWVEF